MAPRLEVHSESIPGSVHPYEDRVLVDERRLLFAVADGVTISSRGSGGVAAEHAVRLLRDAPSDDVAEAVALVHRAMVEMSATDDTIGETTLTAARVRDGRVEVANVGDSPAYLARGGSLEALTSADRDAFGGITQVVGYPEDVLVHHAGMRLMRGDYVLIASDGLNHVLDPATVLPPVREACSAEALVDHLIREARTRRAGYDDDKSLVVLRVLSL